MARTNIREQQIHNQDLVSEREIKAGWLTQPVLTNITILTFNAGLNQFVLDTVLSPSLVREGQYFNVTSGAATGTYQVSVVTPPSTITVTNLEVTGSGGVGSFFEPPASENIGISTEGFTILTGHSRLQNLLVDLDQFLAGLLILGLLTPSINQDEFLSRVILAPIQFNVEMRVEPDADALIQDTFGAVI